MNITRIYQIYDVTILLLQRLCLLNIPFSLTLLLLLLAQLSQVRLRPI